VLTSSKRLSVSVIVRYRKARCPATFDLPIPLMFSSFLLILRGLLEPPHHALSSLHLRTGIAFRTMITTWVLFAASKRQYTFVADNAELQLAPPSRRLLVYVPCYAPRLMIVSTHYMSQLGRVAHPLRPAHASQIPDVSVHPLSCSTEI